MAVLYGLMVAACFGSGDFLGGLASRRAPTIAVLAVSQMTALLGALLVVLIVGGQPHGGDVVLGLLAGVLNLVAIGCLYRGLAVGQMGQVAPIAAVIGAVLPVLWALLRGERPATAAFIGIGLAMVAAALLSADPAERRGPLFGRALGLAIGAGIGFGISLILFAAASHHGGYWPVLSARVAAFVAIWMLLAVRRGGTGVRTAPKLLAGGAGLLDVGATTLLLAALRTNLTALVAPVASLAPGFTTLHAWWYLRERLSRVQLVGVVLALVGLGLIAAS